VDRITKILTTTEKKANAYETSKKVEYWSKFANTIDGDEVYVVGESIHHELMERVSGESGLVELIELGCGSGLFTKVLAENTSHVMATDLSDEMLAVARTQL
jgi:predicted TPR repeat methyltransferase